MDERTQKILKILNPNRILLPMLIGAGFAVYMVVASINFEEVKTYFAHAQPWWILLALLALVVRDAGYMYRIRHLTNKELSWKSSVYSIFLWEFSSAVTPSAVGGTAVAVFILNREGISFGKSMAYVMLTSFLDNLFFIIASPIAILLTNGTVFPENIPGLQTLFITSYALTTIYTLFFAFGLFFAPKAFKQVLIKITTFGFLKRWQHAAEETGDEVIIASAEMKGKALSYWLNAVGSTIFVWSARYFMVNCLLAAFADINFAAHWLIFAKHVVLWVVMIISPTPGGAGTTEAFFQQFFQEFVGTFSVAIAIFWRLLTYYPYLIIGALILPNWIRRVFSKKEEATEKPVTDSSESQ